MLRNTFLSLFIIAATLITANWLLNSPSAPVAPGREAEAPATDYARGPHNGRLLEQDSFAVEITIFETGVPPEFRVYPYYQDRAIAPGEVSLSIELGRTGNVTDRFGFAPEGDLLRGDGVVTEPHSFDVTVTAGFRGTTYEWRYASYEGRTVIPAALAAGAGVETGIAGPATIVETIKLTGRVGIDPDRVSQVRPRFPGLVKRVHAGVGDAVRAGDPLLSIESSESLREYTLAAPISGIVTARSVQAGEAVTDGPLLSITDLSRVRVELDVFAGMLATIRPGQTATIETQDGHTLSGPIMSLSPFTTHASQNTHAFVMLDNPDGSLRPGQFVHADVAIATHEVPLAVRRSGVQDFRDFQVVYAKFDDTYEVRMLDFGIGDSEWVEVTGGLTAGTEYVTKNSYLIKADIEKSGASHDH